MLNMPFGLEDGNTVHTGRSPRMCRPSRHQYIAFGATIPLFLLHEYREYTVQGTAWWSSMGSREIFVFIWFYSSPNSDTFPIMEGGCVG